MKSHQLKKLDRELDEYVESLTADMGRPERRDAMGQYVTGLLLDGHRKSMEPMAARLVDDPGDAEGMRQRLQQCVSISPWDDKEMFRRVALKLDKELPKAEALVVDDTGFAKKGTHSVGVARQYSGTLGRVDNCPVATSLHLAGEFGSGCIGMRLYLPKSWTEDRERCRAVGVPQDVAYMPKWKTAHGLIDDALAWGVQPRIVLADSWYGDNTEFREGLTKRELIYNVGVKGSTVVWPPGTKLEVPKRKRGKTGRRPTTPRSKSQPTSITNLAKRLGRDAYRKVTWRDGSRGKMSSRFAAVRIRSAHRHAQGRPPGKEEWLLIEWPKGEKAQTKFFMSTQSKTCSLKNLVRTAKLRWRVERDYQDMKEEIGLDHFEGRKWRGFHHHAALCAAAHAFLALRRALSPPEERAVDIARGATATAAAACA